MSRILKALLLASVAFTLLGPTEAWASEFHCSVEPCNYTLKTNEKENASFELYFEKGVAWVLCQKVTGEDTVTSKTTSELTITNLAYHECKSGGKGAKVRTNECDLLLDSAGTVAIQGCAIGKSIELELETTGCLITVGEQGPMEGLSYSSSSGELALTIEAFEISATTDTGCASPGSTSYGGALYTTSRLTGESDPGGQMATLWHDPEFHCTSEPCRLTVKPDGELFSQTAYQRIRINGVNVSTEFICTQLTGEATVVGKTTPELTLTNLGYEGCLNNTFPITVKMNGCHYRFHVAGTLTIVCPKEKSIEIEGPFAFVGVCKFTVGSQGPLSGVSFNGVGGKNELTVQNRAKGVVFSNDSFGSCPVAPVSIEFNTGNFKLTAETDPGGVMGAFWLL